MRTSTLAALETIDAALFSGDEFENVENLKTFKEYLSRWKRELDWWKAAELAEQLKNITEDE